VNDCAVCNDEANTPDFRSDDQMPGQIRRRQTTDGGKGKPQAVFQRAHPTKPGKRLTTTKTFATVKDAKSWLAEMTVKHDADPLARPDRAKTTCAALVETWVKGLLGIRQRGDGVGERVHLVLREDVEFLRPEPNARADSRVHRLARQRAARAPSP
jgi:hypothetical protein